MQATADNLDWPDPAENYDLGFEEQLGATVGLKFGVTRTGLKDVQKGYARNWLESDEDFEDRVSKMRGNYLILIDMQGSWLDAKMEEARQEWSHKLE